MTDRGHSDGRRRLRRAGWWAVSALGTAAGVWAATLTLRDFPLDGSAGRRVAAILLVAALFLATESLLTLPVNRALARTMRRNMLRMREEPDLYASDREFFAPFRRHLHLMVVAFVVKAVTVLVLGPAVLWSSIRLSHEAGLPVRLTGVGPVIVASLIVYAVRQVIGGLPVLATKAGRAGGAARTQARFPLCLAGLWFAVAEFGGVRLDAGPGGRQLAVLAVVAALYAFTVGWFTLSLPVPGLVPLGVLVLGGLRLWLVTWLSTWMHLTLRVSGFWTFLLTALLLTALMWPARERRVRRPSAPLPPHPMPGPFPRIYY